jgi:DNA-binding transcriptional MerR regulator
MVTTSDDKRIRKRRNSSMLKISKLAIAADVSIPTIHYYIREGLLEPPQKTSRNMAYYDTSYIEEIKFIKNLQSKRNMPLSSIKLFLKAKREGNNINITRETRSLLEDIYQPLESKVPIKRFSIKELAATTGLSAVKIQKFINIGLLIPSIKDKKHPYDELDANILKQCKRLTEIGIKADDLNVYRTYTSTLRKKSIPILRHITKLMAAKDASIIEIADLFINIKSILDIKVYLQLTEEYKE